MTDNTPPKPQSREEFEAKLRKQKEEIEAKKQKIIQPNGGKPDDNSGGNPPPPNGGNGNSGGNPSSGNGGEGNTGNRNPDEGQNPPQPNPPAEEYDESSFGISSAYDLKSIKQGKKTPPAKTNSGASKAPERKKNGYKPGSSNDFLQACYNEIIVAAYAGAIDFAVDLTLDIFDWILFAPLSNGKSAEKKPDKKDKTVFDYADELINENKEKGKNLIQSFLVHHKEIMDNVERAQNGQTPQWNVWKGQTPQCFDNLVEIKTKADADPNSPEAKLWENFKNLPQKVVTGMVTEVNIANYAVHHAALTTKAADVEPIPVDVTKAFKNMQKMVEDPQLDDTNLKAKISQEIADTRQHLTANTPVNQEITDKLNEFAQVLIDPNANREAIAAKIIELQQIHPIKNMLREKAVALGHEIKDNLAKIDLAYANNPEQAKAAKEEYLKKIHETQKDAGDKTEKDLNANWLKRRVGIRKYGNTKKSAETAREYANNTLRHVRVPQNDEESTPDPKKTIQNDADIINYLNSVGLRR